MATSPLQKTLQTFVAASQLLATAKGRSEAVHYAEVAAIAYAALALLAPKKMAPNSLAGRATVLLVATALIARRVRAHAQGAIQDRMLETVKTGEKVAESLRHTQGGMSEALTRREEQHVRAGTIVARLEPTPVNPETDAGVVELRTAVASELDAQKAITEATEAIKAAMITNAAKLARVLGLAERLVGVLRAIDMSPEGEITVSGSPRTAVVERATKQLVAARLAYAEIMTASGLSL